MNSPEFQHRPSLEQLRQELFVQGAARLIAYGKSDTAEMLDERAVSEDRNPLSFHHNVPLELVADESSSHDVLVHADLSFVEARLDPYGGFEYIPASLTLLVQKIDHSGSLIDEEYFISQEESPDGQNYMSSYLHGSSSGHELTDMLDDQYARDLTEQDIARLQTAIDSLPAVPSMQNYLRDNQ